MKAQGIKKFPWALFIKYNTVPYEQFYRISSVHEVIEEIKGLSKIYQTLALS